MLDAVDRLEAARELFEHPGHQRLDAGVGLDQLLEGRDRGAVRFPPVPGPVREVRQPGVDRPAVLRKIPGDPPERGAVAGVGQGAGEVTEHGCLLGIRSTTSRWRSSRVSPAQQARKHGSSPKGLERMTVAVDVTHVMADVSVGLRYRR
ncbi:hypothetical protein ACIQOV_27795 [Kitasatospora sp. NPDC091257]|uniref:hypothetical protein n=1 Tax=Kitasatospora sp. NPDC091257 TaxID=3364084 RepID=UPI0038020F8C